MHACAAQIIRGVALGLALIMYGQEESAETLIEQMTRDQDPIIRCRAWSAVWALSASLPESCLYPLPCRSSPGVQQMRVHRVAFFLFYGLLT